MASNCNHQFSSLCDIRRLHCGLPVPCAGTMPCRYVAFRSHRCDGKAGRYGRICYGQAGRYGRWALLLHCQKSAKLKELRISALYAIPRKGEWGLDKNSLISLQIMPCMILMLSSAAYPHWLYIDPDPESLGSGFRGPERRILQQITGNRQWDLPSFEHCLPIQK